MAAVSTLALRSILDRQLSDQLFSVSSRAQDLVSTRKSAVVGETLLRAAVPVGAFVVCLGPDEQVVLSDVPPGLDETVLLARVQQAGARAPVDLSTATGSVRAVLVPVVGPDPLLVSVDGRPRTVQTLVIGFDTTRSERLLRRMALLEIGLTLVACLVIVLLLPPTLDRGLRRIRAMTDAARAVARGEVDRRLPSDADVSETVVLANAVNDALDARQDAEARLRQFVADASHELRTPLTTIEGWAELHRQGHLHDPQLAGRAMDRIADSAAHLTALVEDLAMLARLDAGRPIEHRPVDLAELAATVVEDAAVIDPSRTVTLAAPAEDEPAAVVQGDDQRLRQVVLNLVGNALQHTPAGTPIDVGVHRDGDRVTLTVSDAGPGIPAEHQARIFDRFYRGAASRSSGGTGLGLAIVRSLVDAHGGTVDVRSDLGGTRFTVVVPAAPQA